MNHPNDFTFDRMLETLAEKLAGKLLQEPSRLYPRLLTTEQAAVYLGWTVEALQRLTDSGKLPVVLVERRVLLDRLDLDEWIRDNKTGWV